MLTKACKHKEYGPRCPDCLLEIIQKERSDCAALERDHKSMKVKLKQAKYRNRHLWKKDNLLKAQLDSTRKTVDELQKQRVVTDEKLKACEADNSELLNISHQMGFQDGIEDGKAKLVKARAERDESRAVVQLIINANETYKKSQYGPDKLRQTLAVIEQVACDE